MRLASSADSQFIYLELSSVSSQKELNELIDVNGRVTNLTDVDVVETISTVPGRNGKKDWTSYQYKGIANIPTMGVRRVHIYSFSALDDFTGLFTPSEDSRRARDGVTSDTNGYG